ncbi:MAG: MFS transporter [Candidatus Levybacteria bacterium]|nr:MFS transporter [Candidatus Levybacteria bacterium]
MDVVKKRVLGNNILQVLAIKPFLLMMLSEFFSQLAFNMQHFVLIFIIYNITRSNTAVSGMILSFMIPAVIFSVITGVYVDRWNKKKVLVYTNLIRGLLILPFLIPDLHLGLIYFLTFLIAVATQFFIPAESAIIPQLVPKHLLMPANAVFAFGIYASTLIGYVFAGPMLLLFGETNTIIFLGLLFLVSALFVILVKLVNGKKEAPKDKLSFFNNFSIAKETREIFSFIRKARKVMHALVMLTIAQAIIFMFAVLAPGYVTTILQAPLESLSWILIAPAGLGLGLGAFFLGSIGKKFNHRCLSAIGFMITGIIFILLPFTSRVASYGFVQSLNNFLPNILDINILHIIVVLAFVIGFSNSFVFIPSNTTIQIETGEDMRGRMYGLLNSLVGAVSFLPVVLAGGLADLLGVGAVIASVGVIMVILSMYYLFLIKF